MHEPILQAGAKVLETEQRLERLQTELEDVQNEISMLAVPDRPSKIFGRGAIFGLGVTAYRYKELKEKEGELLGEINGLKWVLGKAKEEEEKLKAEREDHRLNAIELSRQYNECVGNDKKNHLSTDDGCF